jgi:membrane-associated phospholipid phosphatase
MSGPNTGSNHLPDTPRGLARPLLVLLLGVVGFFLLLPADGWILGLLPDPDEIGGDLRLVLLTLQQYGQGEVIVLVMIVIWLMDEPRRPWLADYLLAALCTFVALNLIKQAVGRPRPDLADPLGFVGAFGTYTTDSGAELSPLVWHPDHSYLLWSTASSHTAFAVLMTVFLGRLYPKLNPLIWPLAILVGFCRMLFGEHYASDVVLGGAIGYALGSVVIGGRLGGRLLGWVRRPDRSPP